MIQTKGGKFTIGSKADGSSVLMLRDDYNQIIEVELTHDEILELQSVLARHNAVTYGD